MQFCVDARHAVNLSFLAKATTAFVGQRCFRMTKRRWLIEDFLHSCTSAGADTLMPKIISRTFAHEHQLKRLFLARLSSSDLVSADFPLRTVF